MSQTRPGFGNYAAGERHPNWTGDDATYRALHTWISRHKQKPDGCQHCGRGDRPLEWANVSKTYQRDLGDWIALCTKCHRAFDRKPECPNGHPRTGEHVFIDERGIQKCRTCKNERWRRRYYEKQGRAVPA